MVDYKKAKIYKIVDNTNNNIYIGSTTQELSKRLGVHRSYYRGWKNNKIKYTGTSSKILENDNYQIVLIESVVCNNKEQLLQRERHYIDTLDCVNKVIPLRTKKEYRKANRDRINAEAKKYRKANREKISEYKREYYKAHKMVLG
jgi:GIY-YIG catalytic domain